MPYNAKKIAGRVLSIAKLNLGVKHEISGERSNVVVFRQIDSKFATTTNGAIVKISNGEVLPDDEPLFLLRARDKNALRTLHYYYELCAKDTDSDWQTLKMTDSLQNFMEFSTEHPERMKQPGITKGE